MNSLLSLSFLSSGPVAAGAEPAANATDAAVDISAGDNQFGRLLNQSGEQQQAADRQSFAGFHFSNKSKSLVSLEGQLAGRPEISLPPVIPPEAELSLAEDNHAGVLLGFLDQASQTRLQLMAQANEKGQAGTTAAKNDKATGEDVTVNSAGEQSGKGEGGLLPVAPDFAKAGAADSVIAATTATASATGKPVADKTAAALLTNITKASDALAEPGVAVPETLSEQNTDAPAASKADMASSASDKAAAKAAEMLNPAAAAAQPGQSTVAESAESTVAVNTDAELLAQQAPAANNARVNPELMATSAAPAVEQPTATSSPPLPAATILFDKPAATIFEPSATTGLAADDGTPGSMLASAAAVAESTLAKQQQRADLADTVNQTKQALAAGAESAGQNRQGDAALVTGGQRAEASLSGFSSVFSPAAQSQGEIAAARGEAATIAGAQQTTEQSKAQSVNKSVTEQLKQVNLLAQNAAGQLRERVNLMVRQNIQVAEIRLDPADLGQMQIRINLQQEQATVQFIVQQQHAKELLEQQMPRLREMLQQQGIQLGEGQVQQQRQGDSQANGQPARNNGNSQDGQAQGQEQATAVQLEVKLSERIVDYYA